VGASALTARRALLERPLHSFPEPAGVGAEVPERDRARGVMAQEGAHVGQGGPKLRAEVLTGGTADRGGDYSTDSATATRSSSDACR